MKIRLVVPETGDVEAMIDTGCTRCLIGLHLIKQLGIKIRPLICPICIDQVDGMLIGGVPVILVTELIKLELGCHQELIRFVVALKMMESVIWACLAELVDPDNHMVFL